MSDATNAEIMAALAAQLETQLAPIFDGQLQVEPRFLMNATPPTLDIYPGDPFGEQISFGVAGRELLFTVRARITAVDQVAGQDELLRLMDRNGGSVLGAIAADRTLGGVVDDVLAEGPSGYRFYGDPGANGALLGCEWRVSVEL